MKSFKFLNNIIGWAVFAVAATVYVLTAEATGSLWDCGEFIAGADKLQVVHPPGAPLFLLVGRMFTFFASVFSDTQAHPENIAYAVNVMSGICTAFAVLFIFWSTTILSRMVLVGRNAEELSTGQSIAVLGAGVVAGLASTFATSVWFSAVEGEVYAMSTFFTALVMWAGFKWYNLPDESSADRWLVFAAYMAGLSIGVHLLSLLTFPLLGILYVLKKNENASFMKIMIGAAAGVGVLVLVQGIIILKFPGIAAGFDRFFVNSLGLPPYSGVLFFIALLITGIVFGVRYAHQKVNPNWQKAIIAFAMVLVGFSTYGVVVLRAYANTPINMNNPSDVYSLVSYLNREQYGDRPLLYGPHFDARPIGQDIEDRYGYVVDKDGNGSYQVVDRKIDYIYRPQDKMFFPRIGHYDRKDQHRAWMGGMQGTPTMADNLHFFFKYQISWMYVRYFMWNFVGRQNGDQGFYPEDVSQGNWVSGVGAIDKSRLGYDLEEAPRYMKENQALNTYFFLPLIFGFIGLIFHFVKRTNDAWAVLAMFLMTGLAIIIYSNQPPNEPRERDYVLAGSMMTFCIWIGMSVVAIYSFLSERGLPGLVAAVIGTGLAISAPIVMGNQNWDDHNRSEHTGARDYAVNFLESCQPNAIIFTHGDNDTYPLWYAQEVEGIRTDVRVVNLSLLAVDWYIDQLRRTVNKSPKIEMTIPESAYRGYPRNFLRYNNVFNGFTDINKVVQYIGQDQNGRGGSTAFIPTHNISIPVDKSKVLANGTVMPSDTGKILNAINFTIPSKSKDPNSDGLQKDEIAILDIIASNNWNRPIYFSVTCQPNKLIGLNDYLQLEGMGLRLIPIQSQSDGRFGMLGSGRVAVDTMYNNIMTKFKWGNFDKKQLFVDKSYNPSVYSMRGAMIRLATTLLQQGDKERAMKVADKCLEVYPNMNFPYDTQTLSIIRIYEQAGDLERGKKHVITLAEEFADRMRFYKTLTSAKALTTFNSDKSNIQGGITQLIQMVDASGSEDLKKEVKSILANDLPTQNVPN